MTGFPGETEAEFAETRDFIESHPFTYLHVFTYSERPGTAAAQQGSPIATAVRQERTRILRDLSEQKNHAFRRRMIGQTLSAVTLEQRGVALTTNFLKVEMAAPREPNQIVELPIASLSETGLRETHQKADGGSLILFPCTSQVYARPVTPIPESEPQA
jgi:threonylcarbamoyladenosine tRNA methylthiotransferase MtaB